MTTGSATPAKLLFTPQAGVETVYYKVSVERLSIPCRIGIHQHERDEKQVLVIDIDVDALIPENLNSDKYQDVICYDQLATLAQQICEENQDDLLETLAWKIGKACLKDDRIESVKLSIRKPQAIKQAEAGRVEVQFRKTDNNGFPTP